MSSFDLTRVGNMLGMCTNIDIFNLILYLYLKAVDIDMFCLLQSVLTTQ